MLCFCVQSISAKVGKEPCCDWVGESGSGHFVKMVHNGIEYGDMQLICEAYHLMKDACGLDNQKMSEVFTEWNKGELDSFLIEITSNILKYKDTDGMFQCIATRLIRRELWLNSSQPIGKYLVEKIRDSAGQKGTGKWTAISALDYGIPVTLIGESVFSRCLSSLKEERVEASKQLPGPSKARYGGDVTEFVKHIQKVRQLANVAQHPNCKLVTDLRTMTHVFCDLIHKWARSTKSGLFVVYD